MNTRTGNFLIGFRRGWSAWQQDLSGLLRWAKENGLSGIDLGHDADAIGHLVLEAGLRIGSVDLKEWRGMISPDPTTRRQAVEINAAYIERNAALGPLNYFVVMLPEQPELSRAENFGYMVESFSQLIPALEAARARIVIEGWPGPGALCCTPEGYRAFFRAVPSEVMGINYDPSHLVRMGIDPIRFLREFAARVYHVHGKDTELDAENLYEFGHEQPPTFAKPIPFGGMAWRYCIPGHGQVRWVEVMRILAAHGYAGMISIELEDANFNGEAEREQQGILLGAHFLAGC
ncbi:MAG: sugar phosphate isomerase/epimerase [Thermoflexales bacterium]|nr:sugar phosphate isomerase/epimerase [Thermoflexales bacterium]